MASANLSTAQRHVLIAVKRRGEASADEVAEILGITPSAVRQHLAALRSGGFVASRQARGRPGRPADLYHSTELGESVFAGPSAGDLSVDTVAGLAAILDAEGYMADVDKLPGDSYRLTLHSCAIWAVASHYGLACTTELEFVQEVVPEAEVTRIVHKVAGAYVCAYEIRPRATTPRTSRPKARRDLASA